MGKIHTLIQKDIRYKEALSACMNCGICTAICPAAEFYKYDPRQICSLVQTGNEEVLENLLQSEEIWYCGQCMSCKTRCPRGNVPGLLITVLRKTSQELGVFTASEKGRQQYAIKKVIGENILNTGYCVHPDILDPEMHPEQGPIWKWYKENIEDVADRLGANYNKPGAGALRIIPEKNKEEIRKIFEITGGGSLYEKIEYFSEKKAEELNMNGDNLSQYMDHVLTYNSDNHQK